jgi:hypothetical protein
LPASLLIIHFLLWKFKDADWDLLDGDVLQWRLHQEPFDVIIRDDVILG